MNNAVNVGGINKIPNKSGGVGTAMIAIIVKKQIGIISNGRTFCSISLIDLMPKTKTGIIIAIKKYSVLSFIIRKIIMMNEAIARKRISFFSICLLKATIAPPKIKGIPTY
tara:strand:- start:297 stop:629 length:333 start_codon:yes stop_codon:yes gene_type:complete